MTWSRRPHIPILAGAVVGLLLVALVGYRSLALSQTRELEVFGDAPTFTLTDQLERPVRSDDLRGRVVVANFIYTNCPDICPLLSLRMQALQERLREEGLLGEGVQLLSFTVDPGRDTPPVLRTYAERHRADPDAWRFLTGPEDELVPMIVEGFHLGVDALPPKQTATSHDGDEHARSEFYEVMHSGRFVLIDRQWRIRAYYDGRELDLDRVVADIRQLLRS